MFTVEYESIVKVDKNGKLEALKSGKTTLLVKDDNGHEKLISVVVMDLSISSIIFDDKFVELALGNSYNIQYSFEQMFRVL